MPLRLLRTRFLFPFAILAALPALSVFSAEPPANPPPSANPFLAPLHELDLHVASAVERDAVSRRLGQHLSAQLQQVNRANTEAWRGIDSRVEWENFRDARLADLRRSLRIPRERPPVKLHVVRELNGDAFRIRCLIYETRPGWFVTANLYLPQPEAPLKLGVLLSHSHHNPKTQGELQDMGMTWARAGCAVLVPDHLGHGERRQHPFESAQDFSKPFPVGRQDYHFRYDAGMQLALVGESLMGWLAWDLLAGVDVLRMQSGMESKPIALLGAVAGGGDPAGVAAALDDRIACAAPFNYGGPQPETRYPLPDDAETWFPYAGGGSWESSRNLAGSADGLGFQPWVVAASLAPRRWIHSHEFSWDRDRDPVYRRYQTVWNWYNASDHLGFAHGKGTLRGSSPESSHCDNIGAFHRRMIHPLFARWFDVHVAEADEYRNRRPASDLLCWTDSSRAALRPQPLHRLLQQQAASVRPAGLKTRETLRPAWSDLLRTPVLKSSTDVQAREERHGELVVRRVPLNDLASLVLLSPASTADRQAPWVVGVSDVGKSAFLEGHAKNIADLLQAGVAVALVDVRGTGEGAAGDDRGQNSAATAHSATAWMLGQSLVGGQLGDLQQALAYLRTIKTLDPDRGALWGASFTPPWSGETPFQFPRRVERPAESSPLGSFLVLLAALHDDRLAGVVAHGGLVRFSSALDSPFVQIPHASIVPGLLSVGDLPELSAALDPAKLRIESPVDGLNRLVPTAAAETDPDADRLRFFRRVLGVDASGRNGG